MIKMTEQLTFCSLEIKLEFNYNNVINVLIEAKYGLIVWLDRDDITYPFCNVAMWCVSTGPATPLVFYLPPYRNT